MDQKVDKTCLYLLLQQNEFEEDHSLRRERKMFTGDIEIWKYKLCLQTNRIKEWVFFYLVLKVQDQISGR